MNLEHLRSFLTIVELGSFHAAANARRISQPALTKQMQAFERWAGTTLIDRSRHGAVPTATGRALLEHARLVLGAADGFADHARRLGSGDAGRLAIGFGMSSLRQVPAAVHAFRAQHPDVEVRLEDLSSVAQREQLRAGTLDLGFGRRPEQPDDISYRPVWTDRLAYATTSPDVSPAHVRRLLAERPLLRLAAEQEGGLAAQVDALERTWGVKAPTLSTSRDLLTLIAMASAGVGGALVPASAAYLAPAGLHLVPVDDPSATWSICAMWRGASPSPAAATFLSLVG